MEEARATYQAVKSNSTPPGGQPAVQPPQPIVREKMSSVPDLREIGDATVSLRASVDTVCEAIMFVFAKITEVTDMANQSAKEQKTTIIGLKLIGAIQMLLIASVAVAIWRVEHSVHSAKDTQKQQIEATQDIKKLARELDDLRKQSLATKKTVDEVKKKADEAPRVEIVPDSEKPGSAVVRIVPKAASSSPVGSAQPIPSESAVPVEIPIRDDARPSKRQRRH